MVEYLISLYHLSYLFLQRVHFPLCLPYFSLTLVDHLVVIFLEVILVQYLFWVLSLLNYQPLKISLFLFRVLFPLHL
ncbi:unnamed protein product [Meloidogyne enterolobii]|uniref:Uncharacterized protein n=1 Tax=Meloidogyne enterolobii TaxID=390850 RepID=A0ACB0ZMT3_MELEN